MTLFKFLEKLLTFSLSLNKIFVVMQMCLMIFFFLDCHITHKILLSFLAAFDLHYNVAPIFSFVFGNMFPTILACIAPLLKSMQIWLSCKRVEASYSSSFIYYRPMHKVLTPNSIFQVPLPKLILIIQSKIPWETNT